jgi:hypothetical protein
MSNDTMATAQDLTRHQPGAEGSVGDHYMRTDSLQGLGRGDITQRRQIEAIWRHTTPENPTSTA